MDGSSAGDGDGDQESQGFLSTLSFCDMMQVRLFFYSFSVERIGIPRGGRHRLQTIQRREFSCMDHKLIRAIGSVTCVMLLVKVLAMIKNILQAPPRGGGGGGGGVHLGQQLFDFSLPR